MTNAYDDPGSFASRFRRQRFQLVRKMLENVFDRTGKCNVLDIGGTSSYWRQFKDDLAAFNAQVTIVNLSSEEPDLPLLRVIRGDARRLDFADNTFDLVHSNSVLEHVGRWTDMLDMAREVRRLAPRYFVQIPYFWFFFEPHFRLPFFHWLPETVRARILTHISAGVFPKADSFDEAMRFCQDSQLLDRTQMRTLFPDARIFSERVFGLTKSLMAVRE